MNVVYLGLGSNLNDPALQLRQAIEKLKCLTESHLEKSSRFYRNPPLGGVDQPDYVNAVVKMKTKLDPKRLLTYLLQIEKSQGRERKGTHRQEARTLDLDLLLFNQEMIDTPELIVPHPRMKQRAFVIYPLLEIEKDLILPEGIALKSLCECVENNLIRISSFFDSSKMGIVENKKDTLRKD